MSKETMDKYTISQIRVIVDDHFRKHIAAREQRVAAVVVSTSLLVFIAAGSLVGLLFGHPWQGAVLMAAIPSALLAMNGDQVDIKIEETTNENLQGIVKSVLSLPKDQQLIAIDDIKRLGNDCRHLIHHGLDGSFGVLLRTKE